ncbi:MAG: exodeoxyribonuclease VII small subunit [Pseudohongiellaceae bacterium]|nr:exodeoxyribonuclease VII small subunit [Pseudohongiellaceae bacterium]
MTKKKDNALSFEDSLASLEEIVDAMEDGELSLEDSLQAFEQGIKLTRDCQKALDKAEQKVQVLMNTNEQDSPAQLEALEGLDDADSSQ